MKKYNSIEEIISTLRKQCTGTNIDGSKKFPIDWALTNGTVLYLCSQIEKLLKEEKQKAFDDGKAQGIKEAMAEIGSEQGICAHSSDDKNNFNFLMSGRFYRE